MGFMHFQPFAGCVMLYIQIRNYKGSSGTEVRAFS